MIHTQFHSGRLGGLEGKGHRIKRGHHLYEVGHQWAENRETLKVNWKGTLEGTLSCFIYHRGHPRGNHCCIFFEHGGTSAHTHTCTHTLKCLLFLSQVMTQARVWLTTATQQTTPWTVAGPECPTCAQVANNTLQNEHRMFPRCNSNIFFMFLFPSCWDCSWRRRGWWLR